VISNAALPWNGLMSSRTDEKARLKTVAIIQARMGSTRLPGKILYGIAGKTVLGHVLSRIAACPAIDAIVVATTTQSADDLVEREARKHGATCFRGSEDDVLSRYHGAASQEKADIIIRITADCPLFDPALLEGMIARFKREQPQHPPADYLSNTLRRTYPRGLDAEIFTFDALEVANEKAVEACQREHVTPYFYQHPDLFRLISHESEIDLSEHRWTLDTQEDLQLIEAVYRALHRNGQLFTTADVLKLLKERPELAKLNAHVEQKKLGQ
jgi:spore coat polysaccharide biosynthesis protein SpsF